MIFIPHWDLYADRVTILHQFPNKSGIRDWGLGIGVVLYQTKNCVGGNIASPQVGSISPTNEYVWWGGQ